MQSVKRQNHKLSEVKIFFVHMGKGLTHHRLHNHITKIFLQLLPLNITRRSLKYYELKNIYHLSFNKDQVRYTEGNKRMGGNFDKYTGHSTIKTIDC